MMIPRTDIQQFFMYGRNVGFVKTKLARGRNKETGITASGQELCHPGKGGTRYILGGCDG